MQCFNSFLKSVYVFRLIGHNQIIALTNFLSIVISEKYSIFSKVTQPISRINGMKYDFDVATDKFNTLHVYAEKFDVNVQTVDSWTEKHGLPYIRPGSTKYTTNEAFNEWLKERNGELPGI